MEPQGSLPVHKTRLLVLIMNTFIYFRSCRHVFFMWNTSMVSFDGGSASKVDDVTALPSRHKMADVLLCNVMTTTMSQHSDDVFYIFNSTVIDWTCFFFYFSEIPLKVIFPSEPVSHFFLAFCMFLSMLSQCEAAHLCHFETWILPALLEHI